MCLFVWLKGVNLVNMFGEIQTIQAVDDKAWIVYGMLKRLYGC